MRYEEAVKLAERLGKEHGAGAADWYWDRTEPKPADYRLVLNGIRDGDPAILDTFPSFGPLSGENADGMTPNKLYEEIGLSELNLRNWENSHQLDNLCTVYEDGFNSGYSDAVEQSCLAGLRRNITFVIEAEIEEQDERKLMSDLQEVLAKANCDLGDDRILDENGEEMR